MSMNRIDVLTPVEVDGTTTWLKVGRAGWNDDGSITIELDVLPMNGKLLLRDRGGELRDRKEI
jgi:hypothetical protein